MSDYSSVAYFIFYEHYTRLLSYMQPASTDLEEMRNGFINALTDFAEKANS